MKLKAIYFFFILFVLHFFVNAQKDTLKKRPLVKLYAFSLNTGPFMNNEPLTVYGLMNMAPNNKLLQQDYRSFDTKYTTKSGGANGSFQTAFLLFNRTKKQYSNKQELRIGIHLQSSQGSDLTFERKERSPFDTLRSHTNPKVYYIDTVKTYTYFLKNEQTNYLVDISYSSYLRPQNKIFSAYFGGGLGYGMIIQNLVDVRYRYYENFEDQDGKTYNYYTKSANSGYSISEQTQLKYSNIYQAALNAGILMRFSKLKKNRVIRFAINMEGKTGLRLLDLPNIGIYKQFFFSINFGVKFYLYREAYK